MTEQEIDMIVDKIFERLSVSQKELLTKKDLMALGYPERMVNELSHLPGGKSRLQRNISKGATVYFRRELLNDDVDRWKRINSY